MLRQIVFKFGEAPHKEAVRIHPGAMTVLVGPNNSGKSLTLREVYRFINSRHEKRRREDTPFNIVHSISPEPPAPGELLTRLMAEVERDISPFREPLLAAAKLKPDKLLRDFDPSQIISVLNELNKLGHLRILAEQNKIDPSLLDAFDIEALSQQGSLVRLVVEFLKQLILYLERNEDLLESITSRSSDSPILGLVKNRVIWMDGYLHHFEAFTTLLDGRNRLKLTDPLPVESLHNEPTNMMMRLFNRPEEMEELRSYVLDAFGGYLALDLTNMKNCRFVLSDKPPHGLERSFGSAEALEYFSNAIEVSDLSDGVKSYIGLHATLLSHDYRVILIDEPEAFLHPPLARRLGYNLTRLASERGASIIAATHSPFFVMGCIEAQQGVNILRLGYLNGTPTVRALPSGELQTMMNDPLLRSSGILNALFHRSAFVCEGDSDQAFYDEINRRLQWEIEEADEPPEEEGFAKDCLFMNAHSKQSVARIVGALRRMGIPAVGIVDLDLLKDSGVAGDLLRRTGAGPAIINSVNTMRSNLLTYFEKEYKKRIGKDASSTEQVESERGLGRLDPIMKRGGIDNLCSETEKRDLKTFLDLMASQGVFIPEKGELEGWLPELSKGVSKGRGWLETMFQKLGSLNEPNQYKHPESGDVWDFMRRVARWIEEHGIDPPKEERHEDKTPEPGQKPS